MNERKKQTKQMYKPPFSPNPRHRKSPLTLPRTDSKKSHTQKLPTHTPPKKATNVLSPPQLEKHTNKAAIGLSHRQGRHPKKTPKTQNRKVVSKQKNQRRENQYIKPIQKMPRPQETPNPKPKPQTQTPPLLHPIQSKQTARPLRTLSSGRIFLRNIYIFALC